MTIFVLSARCVNAKPPLTRAAFLYGHTVCNICRRSFAIRRYIAYIIDMVVLLALWMTMLTFVETSETLRDKVEIFIAIFCRAHPVIAYQGRLWRLFGRQGPDRASGYQRQHRPTARTRRVIQAELFDHQHANVSDLF